MKWRQRLANAIAPKVENSMGTSLARDFLKYGRAPMIGDFSQLVMAEQDKYTGYMYGAIDRIATRVAWLALYNLKTKALPPIMDKAKAAREPITHPYLEIIDKSRTFENYALWHEIQTFLGLKGIYYLLAVRTKTESRVGEVQQFKLLNPYDITRVLRQDTLEIDHYIETRGGLARRIEPHMMIEFRPLNPFSRDEPFAMADAAKDAQFTLKQANEQMRNTLRRNEKFPGAVMVNTSDLVLNDQEMANLRARLVGKTHKDEPLFVEGKGVLDWKDMQVDLSKSLPKDVNEINLNALIAATGVSRTKFGIEQSGVTRDTAEVQDNQFVSDRAMPALQLIVGALNQDYKTNYPDKYASSGFELYIDSPLGEDRDAELKDLKVRSESYDLYTTLVDQGYAHDAAARYVAGEITLEELGEPTLKPALEASNNDQDDRGGGEATVATQEQKPAPPVAHKHVRNAVDMAELASAQASTLQASVVRIQSRLASAVTTKVTKNQYDEQSDIVNKSDKEDAQDELEAALAIFYLAVMPLAGSQIMQERLLEFSTLRPTTTPAFSVDNKARTYIKIAAAKAAGSHIDTILGDLLEAVRKAALSGAGRSELVSAITKEFQAIATARAELIASTESYRAFNRAQFDADRQFLKSVGKTKQAYKQWRTRSGNPCPFCQLKETEAPVPFDQPFAELGDVVTANFELTDGSTSVRKLEVDYEAIQNGSLHPRCECTYDIIIKDE